MRRYDPEVTLSWTRRRVELEAASLVVPLVGSNGYDDCPVATPDGIHGGAWATISQESPASEMFDRRHGLIEILGRRTRTDADASDHTTSTTTTTFKLRLRRAR